MDLAKMSFDELNELVGYKVSEPYEEYYAPMQISEKQKRNRIMMAQELDNVFLGLLAHIFYSEQLGIVIASDLYERTRQEYIAAISDMVEPDEYVYNHATSIIANTVAVLYKHRDDPYFYSADRARAIAESEANVIFGHTEYEDAVKNKKFKTWHTTMDGRERDSHAEVNGTTLPILEAFELQGGYLQFPGDDSLDVSESELANCRCVLSFS